MHAACCKSSLDNYRSLHHRTATKLNKGVSSFHVVCSPCLGHDLVPRLDEALLTVSKIRRAQRKEQELRPTRPNLELHPETVEELDVVLTGWWPRTQEVQEHSQQPLQTPQSASQRPPPRAAVLQLGFEAWQASCEVVLPKNG